MNRPFLPLALTVLLLPTLALADASIIQDACEVVPGEEAVLIHFTVANFSVLEPICCIELIPEPQPPEPGCTILATLESDWSGVVNPLLGGAEWFAEQPGDCVGAGGSLSGFGFFIELEPESTDFCCFTAEFCNAEGEVLLVQEECFSCTIVEERPSSWGRIKSIYR